MIEAGWLSALGLSVAAVALALPPVQTTPNDFFTPGTQPNSLTETLISANQCRFCHGDYNEAQAPFDRWAASMMGQSARDPIFRAALAIANQDAANSGETCLRCHAPMGWLNGRSMPSDGSALTGTDFEGVSCSVCHRMVDPEYAPGASPPADQAILAAISPAPLFDPHNGSYVIDPRDRRRGPFDLEADWQQTPFMGWPGFHEFLQSPFHRSSRMCATCHDVSSAHFTKQPDGSFALNELNQPGPPKHQQFPEQRTYSEWSKSLFAQGPIDLGGRFGGTRDAVASCQDCHMPGIVGDGCALEPPERTKLPQHNFNGANSWVLRAVRSLYPDSETGLYTDSVEGSIARNIDMLRRASDLEVSKLGSDLNVRIINFTGHKLPTGYPEGRRMWINVKFLNAQGQTVVEHGAYDPVSADLDEASTKVYETKMGVDAAVSALTGVPAGPSFHLVLNNAIYKDNRIPPMGYNRVEFESVGAGHVPPDLYADGQYWDDTRFSIPAGAVRAEVRVYHQTTSRQYIEFLRDANSTNSAGQTAYDLWEIFGKSAPVDLDEAIVNIGCDCDWNQTGNLSIQDIFDFLGDWFAGNADFNNDQVTTLQDLFDFLTCFFAGCA